jgi:hypothetical protein
LRENDPVFFHIIVPLHNIATKFHDQDYVHKDALRAIPKPKLMNFQINIIRFASRCQPNYIAQDTYAKICLMFNLHLQEAKRLIPKTRETNALVRQLDERIRINSKLAVVNIENT